MLRFKNILILICKKYRKELKWTDLQNKNNTLKIYVKQWFLLKPCKLISLTISRN